MAILPSVPVASHALVDEIDAFTNRERAQARTLEHYPDAQCSERDADSRFGGSGCSG